MPTTSLSRELFPFALEFLQDSRGNLIVDGLDWAPEEWKILTEEKLSNSAMDLASSVADELGKRGFQTLDQVFQEEVERLAGLPALALLVLGTARTAHSGIVGANTSWRP